MNLVKPETAAYFQAFGERRAGQPLWLAEQRRRAIERFAERGFPTRRDEAWRFTNLRPLEAKPLLPSDETGASAPADLARHFTGLETYRVALVDGRVATAQSSLQGLPAGAFVGSLAEALRRFPERVRAALERSEEAEHPFAALNTAFFADGFAVLLDEGVTLDRPVEIVHWTGPQGGASFHLRNLVIAAERSRASIVETHVGGGASWANAVTFVDARADAALGHVVVQSQESEALHFASLRAELAERAAYKAFLLTTGAALSRYDVLATLAGEGGHFEVNGAFLLRGTQEATIASLIDHAAPGCTSSEVVKGVVEDRAHGVFQGKIRVRSAAQKTDAHQLSRNLLLGARAAIDTKPELEILADDVKCSHGATVGELDDKALFYLRSRGIDEASARRMLIEAFAADTLDLIDDATLRPYVRSHLGRWLAAREA